MRASRPSIIDDVVTLLKAEQGEDDGKKAYCIKSFGQTEDETKVLGHQISGHRDAILDSKDQLSNTGARIDAVQMSISEFDVSVTKASEFRRKQYSEFVTLTDNTIAATELFKLAVNRLNFSSSRAAMSSTRSTGSRTSGWSFSKTGLCLEVGFACHPHGHPWRNVCLLFAQGLERGEQSQTHSHTHFCRNRLRRTRTG